jgi:hypothetical protein
MALGNINHFFYGFDVSSLLCQRLSNLEVVNGICELCDDTENVLLDEVT